MQCRIVHHKDSFTFLEFAVLKNRYPGFPKDPDLIPGICFPWPR